MKINEEKLKELEERNTACHALCAVEKERLTEFIRGYRAMLNEVEYHKREYITEMARMFKHKDDVSLMECQASAFRHVQRFAALNEIAVDDAFTRLAALQKEGV